jgi:hypothetical protein
MGGAILKTVKKAIFVNETDFSSKLMLYRAIIIKKTPLVYGNFSPNKKVLVQFN